MLTDHDIRRFYDALGRGDIAPIAELLADDVVLEFPGTIFGGRFEGARRVAVFLRQNQRLFRGGLRFHVAWAAVTGDRAIAQWTNEGITREGKSYANRGVTIFLTAGDRIVEILDYLDTEVVAETWPR